MAQRSSDREAVEAEIDRIRSLGLDDLRTLWRTTFRSSPPTGFTKDLVARFICWRAVTGTAWNGPRFFGLRNRRDQSEVPTDRPVADRDQPVRRNPSRSSGKAQP